MASLKLEHIYKVYPNGHKAVSDFNMQIKDGEFIVFVGPSGCGKSTTLRMIAGLEDISSGELYIGDTLVNDMQPKDRDIAMVFQNYALYPHMTVYENMAFGLVLRKIPRTVIHEKVMWAAEVLGLKDYLDRKPKAMSGGQRQRVSLGRAILRNPKVMLLDEPLSNLDAKLRGQMRSMISKLHQQLKTTFIYVTHDQVEAMTLGTRVVVMKLGRVQQIDAPQNLYDHPINKFVAGFIGTPQMNFFNITLDEKEKDVEVHWTDCEQPSLHLSKQSVLKAERKYLRNDKAIILGFRCEDISVEEEEVAKGDNLIDVHVSHFEELGNETLIYGDLKEIGGLVGDSNTSVIIKATSKHGLKPGDVVKARVNVEKLHLFNAETEMTIIPPIPLENVLPVDIENNKITLFGTSKKPESLDCDFVKGGSIALPLSALKVGEGENKAKIVLIEQHEEQYLALVECEGKQLFVFVDENAKVGDNINFSIDYSRATIFDEKEEVITRPLIERDELSSTFINFRTIIDQTKDPKFEELKQQRMQAVEEKYNQLYAEFEQERASKLEEAKAKQESLAGEANQAKAEMEQKNAEAKAEIKEAATTYRNEVKEIKARHGAIYKEEMAKINEQYRKMKEDEKKDFQEAMEKNKDPESRRARKRAYSAFKESFPLMRANDLETKGNSLDFDKETELNAAKAHYSQKKNLLKDQISENKKLFEETYHPYDVLEKEMKVREEELKEAKENDLLHAQLLFFFKYDQTYQMIPDHITTKIIQGLGSKVFTKVFKVCVPHNAYEESEEGMPFKVVSLVNYGDVQLYKCTGEAYGEKVVIYVTKEREMELGEVIKLRPKLEETQIYETQLNIRLY